MSLSEAIDEFRDLHDRAKVGALGPPDLAMYHGVRDKLAGVLLSAQHIGLQPGQLPRRSLRVARALQVDITVNDSTVRAMTLQVSSGGFAALLARAPDVHEPIQIALRIPGSKPVQARARVVAVKDHLGNANTSFQFVDLDASEAERVEMFVFDALLEQLQEL